MAEFYEIDTKQKAFKLIDNGDLEAIYLFPIEFGGAEDMLNVGFVPVGVGELKGHIDSTIENMALDGLISSYDCSPDYKGNSVVISTLTVSGFNQEGKTIFQQTINIW